MNIQFAIQNGDIYVLEVNPRASRTVPFVSKATGVPLAKIAARVMTGRKLKQLVGAVERIPAVLLGQGGGVPVRQVPRGRSDPGAGDEVDRRGDGDRAHLRGGLRQGADGLRRDAAAPAACAFISVRERDKAAAVGLARKLIERGFELRRDRAAPRARSPRPASPAGA